MPPVKYSEIVKQIENAYKGKLKIRPIATDHFLVAPSEYRVEVPELSVYIRLFSTTRNIVFNSTKQFLNPKLKKEVEAFKDEIMNKFHGVKSFEVCLPWYINNADRISELVKEIAAEPKFSYNGFVASMTKRFEDETKFKFEVTTSTILGRSVDGFYIYSKEPARWRIYIVFDQDSYLITQIHFYPNYSSNLYKIMTSLYGKPITVLSQNFEYLMYTIKYYAAVAKSEFG